MKDLIKKTISVVLCMYFIFMPILQLTSNTGSVNAVTRFDISEIDFENEEIVKTIDANS